MMRRIICIGCVVELGAVRPKSKLPISNVRIRMINQSSLEQRGIYFVDGICKRNGPIVIYPMILHPFSGP